MQDVFAPLNFILLVSVSVAAIAAVSDAKTGLIPNWLTLGALLFGLVFNTYVGYRSGSTVGAGRGLMLSLWGAFVCGFVPFFLARAQSMRIGDLKLFLALGALCGAHVGISAEFYSLLAAAVIAVGHLVFRGVLLRTIAGSVKDVASYVRSGGRCKPTDPESAARMPLGPATLVGVAATAVLNGRFW